MITSPSFTLESFAITDIGHVRSNNEDAWHIIKEKQFYIIADGMGGHNAGEVAASLTVESMCASVKNFPNDASIEETCQYLRESVAKANTKVFEESHRDPQLAGMGTTLSCFIIVENSLIYAHIGDSRLYRFRSQLVQLTEDHSLRQSHYFKEESPPPPQVLRNVITRAIGTFSAIHPDIGVISLNPNDIYLLCSDGLSDYVEEQKITQIISTPLPLEEMGEKMLKAALEKGGNDNITLLLTRLASLPA